MAGIALKGQCDLVSIMVPPEVPEVLNLGEGVIVTLQIKQLR